MKFALIGLAAVMVAAGMAAARADAVASIKSCEQNSAPPSQLEAMGALKPGGGFRGSMSAADLIVEAKKAAKAGKESDAIAWVLLCQWNDEAAQDETRRQQQAVIQYLKN